MSIESPGTYTLIPEESFLVSLIEVGAGGGGAGGGQYGTISSGYPNGSVGGAGGGSGGYRTVSSYTLTASVSYTIIVGTGGVGGLPGNYPGWGDGFSGVDGGATQFKQSTTVLSEATGGGRGNGLQDGAGGTGGTGGSPSGNNGANHYQGADVYPAGGASPYGGYGKGGDGGRGGTGANPGGTQGSTGVNGFFRLAAL